jgi:hypothetical protein
VVQVIFTCLPEVTKYLKDLPEVQMSHALLRKNRNGDNG